MIDYKSELNTEQLAVVQATEGKIACVAAAGSGKTRCIIYRILYLLENNLATPDQIIVVTFTNKAANEIKKRLDLLLNINTKTMLIGTFHSICLKLMKRFKYYNNYTIISETKRSFILKEIIEMNNLKEISEDDLARYIDAKDNTLKEPILKRYIEDQLKEMKIGYKFYHETLDTLMSMDFNGIILKTIAMLKDKYIQEEVHKIYKYILVDEFQDTNYANSEFLNQLCGPKTNITVVGDDYQSIYRFRHADVNIFLDFVKNADQVLYLNTNYRSNKTIVDAATKVIDHNKKQIKKQVIAHNTNEVKIIAHECFNQTYEAIYIMETIVKKLKLGYQPKDFMILSRNRNINPEIEYMLASSDIPYTTCQEKPFCEREEINVFTAILFFLNNPRNIAAFSSFIGKIYLNIGPATISKIYKLSMSRYNNNVFEVIDHHLDEIPRVTKKAKESLRKFSREFKILFLKKNKLAPRTYISYIMKNSGILNAYEYSAEAMESFQEFIMYGKIVEEENDHIDSIVEFSNLILLRATEDETENKIRIMTIHGAKGLESKCVFLYGLEETVFPSKYCINQEDLDEERRIFYVGITRAQDELYLIHTKNRTSFGITYSYHKSKFLKEIPKELLSENTKYDK